MPGTNHSAEERPLPQALLVRVRRLERQHRALSSLVLMLLGLVSPMLLMFLAAWLLAELGKKRLRALRADGA
jgi:hypothetical protein